MFSYNTAPYHSGTTSKENGNYEPNTFVPNSWLFDFSTPEPQQQFVSLADIQGWADVSDDFPRNTILGAQNLGHTTDMPTSQADGANTAYTDMSAMVDTNQQMAQNGLFKGNLPSYQPPGGLQNPSFGNMDSQENQTFDFSQNNFQNQLEQLAVPGANQDTDLGINLESQESQTESTVPTSSPLDFDFSQLPPFSGGEPEGLFDPPMPQNEPAEVVSSEPAPLPQGEAQLQQPGGAQSTLPQSTISRRPIFAHLPVLQLPIPRLTLPPQGAQTPSSQQSSQPQAEVAPSSGKGRKRSRSPREAYPTPESMDEGHECGETQQKTKKRRAVGRDSCESCRRSKVKCVHTPGMEKCLHCEKKGLDCVVTGVDNRTNRTTSDELRTIVNKYHALIQEFVAVLYLVSYRGAETDEKAHIDARFCFDRELTPAQILKSTKKIAKEVYSVENVRELHKHRYQFDRLEKRRAAIKEAEKYGTRVISELYAACQFAVNSQISYDAVDKILSDARFGRFDNLALHACMGIDPTIFTEKMNSIYGGTPRPSPITLEALPRYSKEIV